MNIKPGLNRVSLTLGKGAVTLDAPPGCEVRIDGRPVGKTPLAPIPVWEGSHKIQVISNGAKWSQAFSLGNGERMNFDIETHNGE